MDLQSDPSVQRSAASDNLPSRSADHPVASSSFLHIPTSTQSDEEPKTNLEQKHNEPVRMVSNHLNNKCVVIFLACLVFN